MKTLLKHILFATLLSFAFSYASAQAPSQPPYRGPLDNTVYIPVTHNGFNWYLSGQTLQDSLKMTSGEITPNLFAGFGLNDVEKIQKALDLSVSESKRLVISYNEDRGSALWLVDSAILLRSNSHIIIRNATIKQSDLSRDNLFRTENCGIGKTDPENHPLENISVIGEGGILEGSTNPRATGGGGKTLTLDPISNPGRCYGTDAGDPTKKQTNDFRCIGLIFGYTKNIHISGLKLVDLNAWAFSFERCSEAVIENLTFNNSGNRVLGVGNDSIPILMHNMDGIDLRWGCNNFDISNIRGYTGDDMIAMTLIDNTTIAGDTIMVVTGNIYRDSLDDIHDINISGVNGWTYANLIRVLNTDTARIYNINMCNIVGGASDTIYNPAVVDTALNHGALVVIGSTNYGTQSPIGYCSNINISSAINQLFPYDILVYGGLEGSSFSNIFNGNKNSPNPPVYINPSTSTGIRGVTLNGLYNSVDSSSFFAGVVNNISGAGSGILSNTKGNYFMDADSVGLQYWADYSDKFTDRSLIDKGYLDKDNLQKVTDRGNTTSNTISTKDLIITGTDDSTYSPSLIFPDGHFSDYRQKGYVEFEPYSIPSDGGAAFRFRSEVNGQPATADSNFVTLGQINPTKIYNTNDIDSSYITGNVEHFSFTIDSTSAEYQYTISITPLNDSAASNGLWFVDSLTGHPGRHLEFNVTFPQSAALAAGSKWDILIVGRKKEEN